ncbi:MAG: hypothetical protein ABI629_21445 [bacterium]
MAPSADTRRPRSTSALVVSRPDPAPLPARARPESAAPPADPPWPLWFCIATALPLAAMVAGLWALLLFGDALSG